MKKIILRSLLTFLMLFSTLFANAQRYTSEVFSSVQVTTEVIYGSNFTVFPTGIPTTQNLLMDIYEPDGDNFAVRPLIIYFHTGSFIPAVANQNPTGGRKDSTAVEMCTQFAKRGYVVASATYRQGWVPQDLDQDVRTGTLLQAVYRSIQDAKACVRFFYEDAALSGNNFRVDTNTIILGGQGTGGYIALAYATLDKLPEIAIQKFLSSSNNATYGFQLGMPYVNTAAMGDFSGYGGLPSLNNPNNHVGFSERIHFVFNMGGALGDSSWLEAGDVPMIGFHVTNDPFAPYGDGPVYVPTVPPQFVVDVSGSLSVVTKANLLGNNDCFLNAGFTDPYTLAANMNNNGQEGLFPLLRPVPPNAPGEAGPWEWYDSTALTVYAQAIGLSASAGTMAYVNGLATNPDMSKAKALAYIDTIQNYVNPRIAYCLPLFTGINENENVTANILVYPNPSAKHFTVESKSIMESIYLYDLAGRLLVQHLHINNTSLKMEHNNLAGGIYLMKIKTNSGFVTTKITLE